MKKRNAKVFALFMSVAMAMPNVAAAMPVYAAPEVEEAAAEEEEVEEVEYDDTEVEEEAAAEEEDVDAPVEAITAQGNCGKAGTEYVDFDPTKAKINDEDTVAKDVLWELENGTLRIIADGRHSMDDYNLTDHKAPWIKYADKITAVQVSGELRNIGENAFRDCKNLKTVEINHSVEKVGESAFEGCSALTMVTYPSNDMVAVKVYGPYAFKDCTSLEKISFTFDLTEIDEFCFYNCKSLKFPQGLNLQGNLEVIQIGAFWGCSSLTKLILPSNVKAIMGGYVGDIDAAKLGFTDGAALAERLGLDPDEYVYTDEDDCSNVNELEGKLGAFAGCTGLTSVEFKKNNNDGIGRIGQFAFYGCSKLGRVDLPDTLYRVDEFAFEDCVGISTVTIANSAVQRLYGTFKRCSGITEVTIGTYNKLTGAYDSEIDSIGKETFQSCTSLKDFIWEGDVLDPTPDYIGEAAFRDCTSLVTIELPADLDEIDDRAFQGCTSLTTIDVPFGTTRIGKNAFFDDILLDDIYLPETLNEIGQSAFSCNNQELQKMRLMDVYYSGTKDQWTAFLNKIEKDNDLLIASGSNMRYKANKYFESNIDLAVPQIKDVKYVDGGVNISWDKVEYEFADGTTVSPEYYYIYQNHITDKKIDQQWEQQTPLWERVCIVSGSEDEFTYDIEDTMTAGDVYSFRIRAEFPADLAYDKNPAHTDDNSKLGDAFTFTVPGKESDFVPVESISFVNDNVSVKIDQSIDVAAVIAPENASDVAYGWKAEDPSIAVVTVSEDKKSVTVTGKKEGHTTVTVTVPDSDKTASFEVYVVNGKDILVDKIAFDQEKVSVTEGGVTKISISITPEDATAKFEWESDNEKYATVKVADDEKSAIVTGLKEGSTEITVTANNGVTATIPVTITKKADGDNTISNTFDTAAATKGVAVDANHTMTLKVNEEGNFVDAEITDLNGEVDKTMDSYIANIVTKRDADGNPVEFYSLIFTDGKWDTSYDSAKDGAYPFKGDSYMVAGGVINQTANGLKFCGDVEGWKFLAAGKVVTDHEGLVEYDGEWFWIDDKGSCDDEYAAIVKWMDGDFFVNNGRLRSDFTGFANDPQNETEWYHITAGQVWGDGEITDASIAGGTMTRMVLKGKVVQ